MFSVLYYLSHIIQKAFRKVGCIVDNRFIERRMGIGTISSGLPHEPSRPCPHNEINKDGQKPWGT
jgi:hypothetical protein